MTRKRETIGERADRKKGKIYHCAKCGFKGTREDVLKHMKEHN